MNQRGIGRRSLLALGGSAAFASGLTGRARAEGGVRFVTANNSAYDTLDPHAVFDIGRIAARHPRLRLTIDHLGGRGGLTTLKDAEAMTHMPDLLALAKLPNVAVKATGAPGYSSEAYPFPRMQTYLRQIYDAFGPHRMFWGTDITKMPCSWRQCVTMFTEELPWLSDQDKRLIMGEALCAWWGWNRSA